VLYYAINVGVIADGNGSGKGPDIFVETDLHLRMIPTPTCQQKGR
jgi:hypothetical protein